MRKKPKTSWETSSKWYDRTVGEKGHFYHQSVIFPKLLPLLELKKGDSLLDLGCGQGVLARQLPKGIEYLGVDISTSLVREAKKKSAPNHAFMEGDASSLLSLPKKDFSHAVILLALQNMADPRQALENVSRCLKPGGKLILVLNHPCFRIPRQSHWGVDEKKKLQYRRLDRYLSPLEIPIKTHPGKEDSETTLSFHYPLSSFTHWLKEAGFVVEQMDEWVSEKESTGGRSKMENRARAEFPLFLAISSARLH